MNTESRRGPGSPSALREANRARVLESVANAELSQADIARATGLARSTISGLVRELIAEDLLESAPGTGRASALVRRHRTRGVVVGIDQGRFHLAIALADQDGRLLAEDRIVTAGGLGLDASLTEIESLLQHVVTSSGIDRTTILGGAIALPAPIDSRTGEVASASILPGWDGIDPANQVAKTVGFAVTAHNDTNLGALGEARWGAGQGVDNLAYVWISEGLGAGLIVGGQLYAGFGGIAGELGHTMQRTESGDLCRCGNRGCLETVVSTRSVIRLLEPHVGPLATIDQVIDLAANNVMCSRVLAETGRHIGVAVTNLVNLLDPQRVIIGGDLSRAGDLVLDAIRQVVSQYAIPSAAASIEIVPSELGRRAAVLGAVASALDSVHFSNR